MEYESIKGKTFASNKERYNWYIEHSIEWQEIRTKRLDEDGHQCQMCGADGSSYGNQLQVHHLSYDELDEFGFDVHTDHLITLCGKCHDDVHSIYNELVRASRLKLELQRSGPDKNLGNLSEILDPLKGMLCRIYTEETLRTVIDSFVLARSRDLAPLQHRNGRYVPTGDANFFTGNWYKKGEGSWLNAYIYGLLHYDPYHNTEDYFHDKTGSQYVSFRKTRYDAIRNMILDRKARKKEKDQALSEGCGGYCDDMDVEANGWH